LNDVLDSLEVQSSGIQVRCTQKPVKSGVAVLTERKNILRSAINQLPVVDMVNIKDPLIQSAALATKACF
jgi:phosphopantetheine adenylyltransferase